MNLKHLILSLLLITIALTAPQEERVNSLKGFYDFSNEFEMYSGYLNIQENPLISAHYVFITSKNNPETDDLVLWLNGGPGCSSMLGFVQQFGPHVLNQGSDKLAPSKNPFSWNRKANLLFIESPPGVGFSINEDPSYVQYTDGRTADDNLQSLRIWFKKFPQFAKNRFWIAGQSYAGIYIPQLAHLLALNKDTLIEGATLNFQGLFIGNAALNVDDYWRVKVIIKYFESHYFFGPEILNLIKTCKYSAEDDRNPSCQIGLQLADNAVQRINLYNSIGICYNIQPLPFANQTKPTKRRKHWYTPFFKGFSRLTEEEPGCDTDDSGMIKFFNDPEIQKQLNVRSTKWTPCSDNVYDRYKKGAPTVPLFETFRKAGLKMMLFTGNVDAIVPYIQTEEYIRQIGWNVTKPKRAFKNARGSLQGWATTYENNLVYYVVNAAGHMVPCEKPDAALNMFQRFISDSLL